MQEAEGRTRGECSSERPPNASVDLSFFPNAGLHRRRLGAETATVTIDRNLKAASSCQRA
eukprot:5128182-Pyramimonas_sp.AAC.1